ncbi:methylmalonyl-CoA mutase subunit beta [Bacillus salacetis]|nr:methylmalonyl-CoA mutase family protein [Bacillus salacetis]
MKEMRNASFDFVSLDDWKAKAEESLKGKPIEKLYKKTYEGITLKPLYTKEDVETGRAASRDASKREWKIAQRITAEEPGNLPELLETALSRGQDTVSFADPKGKIDPEILQKIFRLAETEAKPLFHCTSTSSRGFDLLKKDFPEVKGTFAADPIPSLLNEETSRKLESWIDTITYVKDNASGIRTLMVDASAVNEAGANAIQELAYAVSAGITLIEFLKSKEWTEEETASKLVFNFSVGSSFFMEISKLRAFRILWKNVMEEYGISGSKTIISAETSEFTKSLLDPYVNMLRSGNEAFAAVLGGADYLHVSPFDQVSAKSSAFSERIARNTQLILSQESHLNKVSDPAGGSYYIESLTNNLAEKAWKKVQDIDRTGGLIQALQTGIFQDEIQQVLQKREYDTAVRKQNIIGTNVYANLEEELLEGAGPIHEESMPGLPAKRVSESFEILRTRAAKLKAEPQAGLILLGNIKNHKARADFVTGFLAAGGIGVLPSPECMTTEDAARFVKESNADYFIICGQDADYVSMAGEILSLIKDKKIIVDLAGKLNDGEMGKLKSSGLDGNLYYGQNMIEKLDGILSRWEADRYGK